MVAPERVPQGEPYGGMSIAGPPPAGPVVIQRGQEIARVIPRCADSLRVVAEYVASVVPTGLEP